MGVLFWFFFFLGIGCLFGKKEVSQSLKQATHLSRMYLVTDLFALLCLVTKTTGAVTEL